MEKMTNQPIKISRAIEKTWDFVVIGGGMGGGTISYALTKKGFNVLLIEKGLANFTELDLKSVVDEETDPEIRIRSGKWPYKIKGHIDSKEINIWPTIGCGVGGSTLLYAAALQRFDPQDFQERKTPSGETVSWPFTYDELSPYYTKAEKMFSVCGTQDPLGVNSEEVLKDPPAMCEADENFFQSFKQCGLHPYRLHLGVKYREGCSECGGEICPYSCKQGSYNCGIALAQETGNLEILEQANVVKLNAEQNKIKSVLLSHLGQNYEINVKTVVLAAGTLFSPILLLKSKNQYWPNGLANNSGFVGKNLMFHATDFIAFWPSRKSSYEGPNKTIAMRDFYFYKGTKLGEFQSTGNFANFGNVLYALRLMFDQSKFRNIPLFRHFLRIPAFFASKMFGKATVFATILEDNPYPENKVMVDENELSGMRFKYHVKKELKDRYFLFRNLARNKIKNLRSLPLYIGVNLNYGHPSGTCKAGDNPATSVVDKDCKCHSLDNLYIVDGSIMPTSGGTNPSLTIAANALRVADRIEEQLKQVE